MKLLGTALVLGLALAALVLSATGRARWRWGMASLTAFSLAVVLQRLRRWCLPGPGRLLPEPARSSR